MKIVVFWFEFDWSLLGRFDNKSGWHQAITWTNGDSVQWCIYVALGGDELMSCVLYVRYICPSSYVAFMISNSGLFLAFKLLYFEQ